MFSLPTFSKHSVFLLACFMSSFFLAGCGVRPGVTTPQDKEQVMKVMPQPAVKNAKNALGDSPRHQEWVEIDNNGKTIYSRVVYPESNKKAPVVLVIHENKGLTDWVRQISDEIAAAGYIAIAPDLLSSFSDEKLKTSDFATEDEATEALYTLQEEQVMSDLQAVYAYATSLEATNGNVASVGFCRGGSQSFRYATVNPDLDKSFVFYGSAPEEGSVYENMQTPVIAFYGGNDERINATIPQTQEYMTINNNQYSFEMYTGAGHAFMRKAAMDGAIQEDKEASEKAFSRLLEELQELESE